MTDGSARQEPPHDATGEAGAHDPRAEGADASFAEGGSAGSEPPSSGEAVDGEAAAGGADPDGEPVDELTRVAAERDEYLDLLRRERAEFENFRRRVQRERGEALDKGAEQLVGNLLSVLDNFGHVRLGAEEAEDQPLAKGVEMVYRELWAALSDAGLEEVPGVRAPFDPEHHEAMMQVEADEEVEEPYVAEVLRPGYRFKGRVLRPASVSVAQ
ncbi:nucleotide exchange factor GrpE [Egibacter rhizosphaerae]|uniref:nucleotide exchange factor GrpE n=1 Tax=Egibacter rhizosphaerae TaxID=1670831 RepID=UPI0013F146EC|nr:nucleotide exchange factor GrpE [Egibacter rhizosphaerae]